VASARRLPDWASDDTLFSAALRVDPRDPLGNLHFGVAAGRAGRMEEALRTLQRGREGDPASARIAGALAWVHLRRGDGPAALVEARRAVGLAPGFPEARLHLANALHLTGDHPGELAESTRAVALSPRYREARIVRAFARCEVERDKTCEADLDALERDGSLAGADALAARVEAALSRRDLDAAGERLARLRGAHPGDRRIPQLERAAAALQPR
jgi:Flp pilus assembly protein TadD